MKRVLMVSGLTTVILAVVLISVFHVPERLYWEILTESYGQEFENPDYYWDFLPCKTLDEIKVLEYSNDRAVVFYAHDDYQTAYVAQFDKVDGKWTEGDGGRILWAKEHSGGNAEYPDSYWWLFRLREKYENPSSYKMYEENDLIRNPDLETLQ